MLNTSKTTWDLMPLYAGGEDPKMQEDRKKIEEIIFAFIKKWGDDQSYLADAGKLKQALDDYEHLMHTVGTSGNLEYYFFLRSAQDENDPVIKARSSQMSAWSKKNLVDIQFFELSLAKVSSEKQKEFIEHEQLVPYRYWLQRLFAQSAYLLSQEAEKVMVMKSTPAYTRWLNLTSETLAAEEAEGLNEDGTTTKKTFTEILSTVDSTNKAVRDNAAKSVNRIFKKHLSTIEAELNAVLENKRIDDELRGMPRPDFGRLLGDDMEPEVIDTLLQVVSSRFDVPQKFHQLKAKLFGVEKLAYHERNVAYGSFDVSYTYQQAVDLVYDVFQNLDAEFASYFKNFVENGRLDVFPNKGKSGGAFCTDNSIFQPTYILLNYTNKLRDVSTIAHEVGHGIHSELGRKQNALNYGFTMATAEVASTFMEDFVLERLRQGLTDEQKLSLMLQKLNDEVSTIFRQIACYEFEQELHQQYREKGHLSSQEIGELFQKHMKAYMGNAVSYDSGSENWWVYWHHIRSYFYVYSYASGLLISKAMQNKVRTDKSFVKNVKEFLSAAMSDSPANLFLKMGIDIHKKEFWEQGVAEVEQLLDEAEGLARKLGKIN